MPTVAELERLRVLTERLVPISDVTRGETIQAASWNMLVQTVIEVTRTVLGTDTTTVVPPHEHPDQVAPGWLNPQLRTLIEQGPLSDPALIGRFEALERKVDRLAARLEEVNGAIDEVRLNVNTVVTRDLTRQADVTAVRRAVDSLADSRESVLQLRQTLRTLQGDLGVAVNVGRQLTIDGEPLNVRGLISQVQSLEQLRTRLTTPQGTLLDAAELEARLAAQANTLVTQEQLDAALKRVGGRLEPEQLDGLRGELSNQLMTQVNSSFERFGTELRGEVTVRLADVDGLVATAVSNSLPRLQQDTLTAIRPEINAAVEGGLRTFQGNLDRSLNTRDTALRSDMDRRIAESEGRVNRRFDTLLIRQTTEQIDPLRGQISELQEQVKPLGEQLQANRADLEATRTRVEVVAQQATATQDDLRQDILKEVGRRRDLDNAALEQRLVRLQEENRTFVASSIRDSLRRNDIVIRRVAAETAATEVGLAASGLRTEMAGIARDQLAGFGDQMRGLVATEVTSAFNQVPGLVSSEVRRATGDLNDQIRVEIENRTPLLVDHVMSRMGRPSP